MQCSSQRALKAASRVSTRKTLMIRSHEPRAARSLIRFDAAPCIQVHRRGIAFATWRCDLYHDLFLIPQLPLALGFGFSFTSIGGGLRRVFTFPGGRLWRGLFFRMT